MNRKNNYAFCSMHFAFRKFTAWLLTIAMLMTMLPSFTLTAFADDTGNETATIDLPEFTIPNYTAADTSGFDIPVDAIITLFPEALECSEDDDGTYVKDFGASYVYAYDDAGEYVDFTKSGGVWRVDDSYADGWIYFGIDTTDTEFDLCEASYYQGRFKGVDFTSGNNGLEITTRAVTCTYYTENLEVMDYYLDGVLYNNNVYNYNNDHYVIASYSRTGKAEGLTVRDYSISTYVNYDFDDECWDNKSALGMFANMTVDKILALVPFQLCEASVTDKDGKEIGKYKTLAEAFEAAKANKNSTVKLLKNVDLGKSYIFIDSGEFTVDLDEYTISSNTDCAFNISGSATKIKFTGKEKGTVQAVGTESDCAIAAYDWAEVTFEGGTYIGKRALYMNMGTATAIIEDGTFISTGDFAVEIGAGSEVTVNGGEFKAVEGNSDFMSSLALYDDATSLKVTGGKFEAGDDGHIYYQSGTLDLSEYSAGENETALTDITVFNYLVDAAVGTNIKLPAYYGLFEDGTRYTTLVFGILYTVESTVVASVTDKDGAEIGKYESIAEAIGEAQKNDDSVVTLHKDFKTDTQTDIESGKFTLDLNGKNWSCADTYCLAIKGTSDITIKDSSGNSNGAIWAIASAVDIQDEAKLKINGGTLVSTAGTDVINLTQGEAVITPYTISFSEEEEGKAYVKYGISGEYTLPENKFDAFDERYSFVGWLIDGTEYKAGDKITVTSDLTATAIWKYNPIALTELTIGGVDAIANPVGEGWSFDAVTSTLTLDGANITNGSSDYAIRAVGDLNIVLKNKNTVKAVSTSKAAFGIAAIGRINISGSGSLEVEATAEGEESGSYGIYAYDLNVSGGTITAAASGGKYGSAGICAIYGINVSGGSVTGIAKPTTEYFAYGILSHVGKITVSGSGKLTARCDSSTESEVHYAIDTNIYTDDGIERGGIYIGSSHTVSGANESYYDGIKSLTQKNNGTPVVIEKKSSSGGGGGGGSSSTTTTTTKNDDGSTTKTTTNKTTGTTTEVTTNTDGSTTTVETKKDGTVTTTEKDADGNTTTTVENPDGTSTTTEKNTDGSEKVTEEKSDGTTVTTEKDADGTTTVTTENADGSVITEETRKDGTKVTTETTADGETKAEIDLPKDVETEVVIPALNAENVTSVVVTDKDGNKTVITDFEITENGVKFAVSGDCTVSLSMAVKKIFDDVHPVNHWAAEDVDYAYIKGLMKGTSDNLFTPDGAVTRAMLVTVLYRNEGEPKVSGITGFGDLEEGQYYLDAVCWAQSFRQQEILRLSKMKSFIKLKTICPQKQC